ncbi:MAG: metal-dependent hydrolase [Haloarculaceae archaeon]
MPSTLVHVAFAGLLAAALLGDTFDGRALLVVLAVTAIPDLDSFLALLWTPAHRTVLHTLVIPILAGGLLWYDLRVRDRSFVAGRWGPRGVRIAWVSVLAFAVAGIALDLFSGGAVALWPVDSNFYVIRGKIELSNQRGIVQTFVDLDPETPQTGPTSPGNATEIHVDTGVDPTEGTEPKNVERVFPVVRSGWQLLVVLVGTGVTAARFAVDQRVTE